MHENHYVHLLMMTILSFIAMFVLMYAIVDRFENVYPNLNQAYMAGLMAAPMAVIELLIMRGMCKNKTANMVILAGSVVRWQRSSSSSEMRLGIPSERQPTP